MNSPNPLNTDYLLRHANALRQLARSLLRDEHAADDVVQDAWVATLAGPSVPLKKPEAWVRTVVRSLALRRIRGDRRRAAREEFGGEREQESSASADDLAMRKALLGQVVQSCLGLDEPYQTVLYLRYFEGLSPQELGERLGRSTATVKSQLHRGLEKLRLELDREVPGGRGVWSVGLAPLAAVRVESIPSAPTQSAPTLPREIVPGSTLGVPAMSLPLKIVFLFGLSLSMLGALWWNTDSLDSPSPAQIAELKPGAEHRSAVASEEGEINVENGAAPFSKRAAARKSVETANNAKPELSILEAMSNESALSVLVRNTLGHPIEGARLFLGEDRSVLNEIGQSDEAGHVGARWKLLNSTAKMVFAVQLPDGSWTGLRRFQAAAGSVHVGAVALPYESEPLFVEIAPSSSASAPVVLDEFQLLGSNLIVEATSTDSSWLAESPQPARSMGQLTASAGEGALFFRSLAAHADLQSDSPHVQYALWTELLLTDIYSQIEHSIGADEEPHSKLSGVVLDSKGEAAEDAAVALFVNGVFEATVRADESGKYSFDSAPPGAWRVVAGGGRFGRDAWMEAVFGGDELFREFHLERGQEISGTVRDAQGLALAGWTVELESVSETRGWAALAVVDEQGEFSIPNVPNSNYRLLLRQPGVWAGLPVQSAEYVQPGGRYDLVANRKLAEFKLAVKDELGVGASVQVRIWNDAIGRGLGTVSDREGRVSFKDLPAGVYRLEVGAETRGWKDLGEVLIRAGEDVDWGLVSLDPPAKFAWTVDNEERTAHRSLEFFLIPSDATVGTVALSGEVGGDREFDLAPGSYELVLTSDGKPAGLYLFAATSGQRISLDLHGISPASMEDRPQLALEESASLDLIDTYFGDELPLPEGNVEQALVEAVLEVRRSEN